MKLPNYVLIVACALLSAFPAKANVSLPALIADHMVLQQKSGITLWGRADAGEEITVSASWKKGTARTVTGSDGNWQIQVQTAQAGGPYQISIAGKNKLLINDVMLGEVWLCSGQSNMEFPLAKRTEWRSGVIDYEQEVAKASYPKLRMFTVKQSLSAIPQTDVAGNWATCTPETAGDFSAVGYYFGRELLKGTGFPIGIVHSSWGGTPAESWTRKDILDGDEEFKPILQRYDQQLAGYPDRLKRYEERLAQWKVKAEEARQKGEAAIQPPSKPINPAENPQAPSVLYNAMINPLLNYTIKGVAWYQGESNSDRAYQYRTLFPAMIHNWREAWKTELPFYFVQIAPHREKIPEIREAQLLTYRSVPKTGMAVISDLGDSIEIHPRKKDEVGRRLALWALGDTYQKRVTYSGPVYRSMKTEGNKIRLEFDFTDNGLQSKGDALTEFTIAGADQKFVPAKAEIKGNSVIVWSDNLNSPVAVRFAWKNFARANLYNAAGLPASPFRTDTWPGQTMGNK